MQTRTTIALTVISLTVAGCSSDPDRPPQGQLEVNQVQGPGATSPFENSEVVVSGIVSGDFQDNDADNSRNLGGFYLQSLNPDDDPKTSEGVFVFDGRNPAVDVNVDDLVTVAGTVKEHFGETQIAAADVRVTGSGTAQPAELSLPAELEQHEGMLLRLPQTLVVAGHYNLERFGSVQLFAGDRPFSFTNQNQPDQAGYAAHRSDFAGKTILLDDGRREENVTPIRLLNASAAPDYSLRSGDVITNVTGNLRYSRGSGSAGAEAYRLMPTTEPQFEVRDARPDAPVKTGSLRVVGLNTLNFFSSIDSGQDDCGPTRDFGCRGADSSEELERQLAKLVTTLELLDADIVGLMEVENNGGIALQLLLDRLNASGTALYDYVDSGVIGSDVITTAFIYKSDSVSLAGEPVVIDAGVDRRFNDRRNRPALAQAFVQNSNRATLSIVVNHLKSKGSDCDDLGDPDRNDGQGDCNRTRTAAAAAMVDWITSDPTGSGDPDYLVIGDLNAYVFEDPLTTFKDAGFTNLLEATHGGNTWTLVFAGQAGALDHALANPSLTPQVAAATDWHINADEPRVLDYNLDFGRDPSLFNGSSPIRSSDHDPIIIDLELNP